MAAWPIKSAEREFMFATFASLVQSLKICGEYYKRISVTSKVLSQVKLGKLRFKNFVTNL